jgi:solute carrier family 34 (sodium-dependent phosphate cotransporter)
MTDRSEVETGNLEQAAKDSDPVESGTPLVVPLPAAKGGELAWWERIPVGKILLFSLSLYLFILAISLLKYGAIGITPLVKELFAVSNPANSLGFGWLFAYLILSGSPVAAVALTIFDAGVIDQISAFTMITGSRLGASIIVLFIGFLYVLRGRDKSTSLSMGLLSLVVTATTHIPGLFLGIFFLNAGWLVGFQLHSGALLQSILDGIIDPIVSLVAGVFPNWVVFLVGVGITLLSLNLFDKCLPQMTLKESQVGRMSRLVYRPVVMFTLGALITMLSMSVSISLGVLVPLSNRGFVRRENVIPYIMGANITTFIDTLFAAVLLDNPQAFTIVFAEMTSIAIVSLVILASFYPSYQRGTLNFVGHLTRNDRFLYIFMVGILVIPIVLMLL